jgi:hypothetical protein
MKKLLIILFSLISLSLYSQLHIDDVYFAMSSGQVTISDMDFINDGTFTCGTGTVNFTGISNQSIQGTSLTTFNNIKINNNNEIYADVDFDVKGNLEFISGDLDLQDSTVSLGTSGTIVNETETNRIKVGDPDNNTGTITIDRTLNNNSYNYTDLGNIGLEIQTNKNLENITIVRGHQIQTGNGNVSIERYYEIPGIGEIDNSNNIKMKYFNAELNNLTEAELIIFQTVSQISEWWTPTISTVVSNIATFSDPEYSDWIYNNSVTFNGKFTLASKNDPLPIELLSFDYDCKKSTLNWTTSSETNNDYFTIKVGTDFNNSELIIDNKYIIQGSGTSNTLNEYSVNLYENNSYVQVFQTDYDGTEVMVFQTYISCNDEDIIIFPVGNIINNKIYSLNPGMYIVLIDNNIMIKLVIL